MSKDVLLGTTSLSSKKDMSASSSSSEGSPSVSWSREEKVGNPRPSAKFMQVRNLSQSKRQKTNRWHAEHRGASSKRGFPKENGEVL